MAHGDRAGVAVPADLLDAIIEFEYLFVRRPDIEVKLRAAAAGSALAHDLDPHDHENIWLAAAISVTLWTCQVI